MKTDARVKNYGMEIFGDNGERVAGRWTGGVQTTVENSFLTFPILGAYKVHKRTSIKAGVFLSYLLRGNFTGYVYDGYIRQEDPTGLKVEYTGDNTAPYDFSNQLRNFQWGVQLGADWEAFKHLIGPMITIALLGAIESLLCARVADAMTDDRHDPNQELMGQGVANFVVPFFGGIPATGTIARTVTNIKSGAASPVAGIVHALTLLVVILAAAPLAGDIPLAALAAILFFVAWNMGNWREFSRLRQMTMSYKATLITTFLLTVIFDLTVAVEVGLLVSCVFFIYRMNTLTRVTRQTLPFDMPETVECWKLTGALFFGSVSKLEDVTDPKRITSPDAAKVVILDCTDLLNIDNSAMDILQVFMRALKRRNHELIIAGASGHPQRQLQRTGIAQSLGANFVPNIEFAQHRARELLVEIENKETSGKPVV